MFLFIKKIHHHLSILLSQDTHLYQQLIKLINFAAIIIKLNIAFAASMLLKHLINSSQCHIKLAHKVMHYFNQTKFYSIFFNLKAPCLIKLFCFSNDVSYIDDPNTRKSIQSYVFTFFNESIN